MDKERQKLVLEFWDRSNLLTLKNKAYKSYVGNFIKQKLIEDAFDNDITTNSLFSKNKDKDAKAIVVARQSGIIAGIDESSLFSKFFDIKSKVKDGYWVEKGDLILNIYGNEKKILGCERTLLNLLQRMSGIATMAGILKNKTGKNCFISGTRKNLLGVIDKKALSVGGSLTHRLNLADSILIKDNHLRLFANSIEYTLLLASQNKDTRHIEIEVNNEKDALEAADSICELKPSLSSNKLFAIMFDNMKTIDIKNSIIKISDVVKNNRIILFEASGGIKESNIAEYSETGVDIISIGALTHSAKALNLSLEIVG